MQNTQVDPSIVSLMHGVVAAEGTNGNPETLGDKNAQGEYTAAGIGQWSNEVNGIPQALQKGQIPANFAADAKAAGLDPTDFSLGNQNQVLAATLTAGKAKGLTPEQQLSAWNSGDPNAYQTNPIESTSVGPSKTQNVAAYVQRGMSAAQAYAQSQRQGGYQAPAAPGSQPSTPQTNSTSGYQAPTPPPTDISSASSETPSSPGFLSDLSQGNLLGAAGQGLKDVGNTVFPIAGDVYNDVTGGQKKSLLAQAGDLGTSALSAIAAAALLPEAAVGAGAAGVLGTLTGADAATAAGRIGTQAALGGAFGLTNALGQGQTNPGQLAASTALGGATGGLVGGAGELLSKAATYLPQRIARSFLPGINQDTAQYAVEKGLGSPTSMLKDSNSAISSLGNSLGAALKAPQYADITATADDILPKVMQQFPNAGLTPESTTAALMKVAPLQKTLIDKLATGEGLNLDELHTLNSALGKNTFKTVFDDPVTKAGKELASAFYHSSSDFIKAKAPETAALFDQLSKEYPLNSALQKAIRSGQKAKQFNLRDILALIGGFAGSGGNPLVAGGALAGEKLLTNPTVNLKAAGLLSKVSPSVVSKLQAPATALTTGLLKSN